MQSTAQMQIAGRTSSFQTAFTAPGRVSRGSLQVGVGDGWLVAWVDAHWEVAHVLSYRIPQVTSALTRQKKEQIVSDITGKLENSVIVFGLRFKGLDVSAAARLIQPSNTPRHRPAAIGGLAQHWEVATCSAAVAAAALLPPLCFRCKHCRSSAGACQRTPQCMSAKTA